MSFATIMVHVEAKGSDDRIKLAANLASRFKSTLIGLAAWAPRPAFAVEGVIIDEKITDELLGRMRAELDKQGDHFRMLLGADQRRAEWRSLIDLPAEVVAKEARAADLVVVGREYSPLDPYRSLDPGLVILQAGRPVLVVPPGRDQLHAEHILIAWKDSREARRAVADALPFLRDAHTVSIAEVVEKGTEIQSQGGIDDVARYLGRHGISVHRKITAHAVGSVANELLRIAKDENADLIVAGGYGHSRLGEMVFGGVTQELLTGSAMCCLFSH